MSPTVTVDADAFRAAMSCFAAGVTVVTTRDPDGTPHGFTASSFCSVSLDPPLILVCLARNANCYPVFTECRRFAVSILADHHVDVARRFATKRPDKFTDEAFRSTSHGLPAVADALCVVTCDVADLFDVGDHAILIGRAHEVEIGEGTPMVYFNRVFHQLTAKP